MNTKKAFFYQTSIGEIGIAEESGKVTNIFFGKTVFPKQYEVEETEVLKLASREIARYFNGTLKEFTVPIELNGTPFQIGVWNALLTIPYGETRSYKQIAEQIGRPTASRAVGMANGLNPISIIVPCHRVIGASGKLTGYAGGLESKEILLNLERENK